MLCGRTAQQEESPSRDQVRQRLTNQRLNSFADGFLQELRADAFIRFP
jgi:peptidyl-prolyl cis-trans isomerase SurA